MQSAPLPAPDALIGTVVSGRYRVIRLLGEGGMGQVYLAEHVAIERSIALKVLRAEYSRKSEMVSRFRQEAKSASRIEHPNVLDVFDFGQLDDGRFFLAMEYLEGRDLADEMAEQRLIDPARGVRIALQVCRGLQAAHARGVVHRDLKPENVFLHRTSDGEEIVKIVDFGIAQLRSGDDVASGSQRRRLTRTGMIFGTPEYMSPEQAAGKHADHRADVYALGVMLYEMFTGTVPFTDETFLGVLSKHLSDEPPPLTARAPDLAISPQLQAVILRALAKSLDERYASMNDLAQAILATPEGRLHASELSARALPAARTPSFVPPAPGNPTAPEFGVVHRLRPSDPPSIERAQTRPDGTRRAYPSRLETLPSGATLAPEPAPRSRTLLPAIVGALAVVGVLGLLFVRARHAETTALSPRRLGPAPAAPAPLSDAAPPAGTPAAPAPLSDAAPPAGTPEAPARQAEPADAPQTTPAAVGVLPASVRLEVTTEPPGATLKKDGFQVCDATPCTVVVKKNETLVLDARKGSLRGTARVLAQDDQRVAITLAARPKPRPRLCEVEVDGLKILRPCN
ncbi:MAG: serine/threonine-protein kinase [Pseudomonadota bacterium]|nr:MAG: serine/threonine protein kinase [Pseudomonadota bacterium]